MTTSNVTINNIRLNHGVKDLGDPTLIILTAELAVSVQTPKARFEFTSYLTPDEVETLQTFTDQVAERVRRELKEAL